MKYALNLAVYLRGREGVKPCNESVFNTAQTRVADPDPGPSWTSEIKLFILYLFIKFINYEVIWYIFFLTIWINKYKKRKISVNFNRSVPDPGFCRVGSWSALILGFGSAIGFVIFGIRIRLIFLRVRNPG